MLLDVVTTEFGMYFSRLLLKILFRFDVTSFVCCHGNTVSGGMSVHLCCLSSLWKLFSRTKLLS